MKKLLLTCMGGMTILFSALNVAISQVPGSPFLEKAKPLTLNPDKTASKLSPELQQLTLRRSPNDVTVFSKPSPGKIINGMESEVQVYNGRVVIDAIVDGDPLEARRQLEEAGAKITGSFGRVISALVPLASLSQLEAATQLRFVKPAYRPRHQGTLIKPIPRQEDNSRVTAVDYAAPPTLPTVYSQGDTAQGSHLARKKFKADGKGVKVGILSDSYNNLGGADIGVANGELPGKQNPYNRRKPVSVLIDLDSGGIDEGRAMAEIVHDIAPGSEIAFNTAFLGMAEFAQGIVDLAKAGCQVITDDIYYYAEPYFQDGIIAQAIDKVVKKGATYFSAAGNMSAKSYESVYRPSVVEPVGAGLGTAHNFAPAGSRPIYYQPVFVPIGSFFSISFQWDDPFFSSGGAGAKSDLDVYIFDITGNIVAGSYYDNILNGEPVEITGFTNRSQSNTFFVSIVKYAGPDPTRVKYIMFDNGAFYSDVQIPGQFAPTLVGHANSAGAIATAAAWYQSTPAYGVKIPLVEGFSSLGGTRILFDPLGNRIPTELRSKPELTAPDGGNTSFFYADDAADADKLPNFFGTSAAAPHAAGVAALMIDAQKLNTITPAQIKGILGASAYDMDNRYTAGFDKGFDYNTGMGLIRADQSVGEVKFPKSYIKGLQLVSVCSEDPSKTRNWKIVNPNPFEVEAHWFLTGFNQNNKLMVPPGETAFSTITAYFRGRQVPNIVILDWEDSFGFTKFDIASATGNTCDNSLASTQTLEAAGQAVKIREEVVKPEIAEVFPNPSVRNFRLYLSLNKPGKTELTLFGADGKMLYKNNVTANGIHDIDASGYKAGIYLLTIRQGDFTKTLRLVKQ
jgi:hypothetical protein